MYCETFQKLSFPAFSTAILIILVFMAVYNFCCSNFSIFMDNFDKSGSPLLVP